jgi:anti-anti-sigma factor
MIIGLEEVVMSSTIVHSQSPTALSASHLIDKASRGSRPSGAAVIIACGDLDAARIPELRRQLINAFESTPDDAVVIDLSKAAFLSISAARELVNAKFRAHEYGLEIRLVTRAQEVERALEVTGVRPLFRYFSSVRAAQSAKC